MYVVTVHVRVKSECREAFLEATLDNARNTIREEGNLRFDVLRRADDPDRFTFVEVYRDASGMDAHKQTPHYAAWREAVEPMMAEKRVGVVYEGLFPEKADAWLTRC